MGVVAVAHGRRILLPVVIVMVTIAALAVRLPLLGHETGDYRFYVRPWYDELAAKGFGVIGTDFSNYTPPYLYILWLVTFVPVRAIVAIKAASIAFDLILAVAAAAIAWTVCRRRSAAVIAYALVLVAPTVVLNGASWGQCDSIYGACVLLAILAVLRRWPALALLFVGIGIAFKVQAIFLLPWLVVLTARRRIPLRAWLALPIPYIVAIIPAWIAGRPLSELLTIYREQADAYSQLTMNAPSVYAWIDAREGIGYGATVVGMVVIAVAMAAAWRRMNVNDPGALVRSATFFLILVPFVLPHMHERYFYLADAMSVVYAVTQPRRWYLPVLVITASTFAYWPFLYGREPVSLGWLALLMATALLVTAWDVFTPHWRPLARRRRQAGPARAALSSSRSR
jgi:Gpi18-like mannosyltransferase